MTEQQAFKSDGEVPNVLEFRAFPRLTVEAPSLLSPLELRTWDEHRTLKDALERHLMFPDTVMDRLSAVQGTRRAENDLDIEAETVAGLLVRLARMEGSVSEPRFEDLGEGDLSHE